MLQLYRIAPMAGAVKRSAMTRKATVAACWSLAVYWMLAVTVVAAVSEHEEGQLFYLSLCFFDLLD